jgi:hypothetical protein
VSSTRPVPDCWSCTEFFVTHEVHFPYGCRTFAMKTRLLPMVEVERTSGSPCQAFVPRPQAAERGRQRPEGTSPR